MTESLLDRLLNRPPATAFVSFALDPTAGAAAAEAEAEAERAEDHAAQHPQSATAKKAAATARRKAIAARNALVTITVTVSAIGMAAMEQLEGEHPPTDEQIAKATKAAEQAAAAEGHDPTPVSLGWNPDTFPPALLAASLVSIEFSDRPGEKITELTVEQAAALYGLLARLDQLELVGMCQGINLRSTRVESLGKG